MLTIPGKYVNKDGGTCTVLMVARDGETGEKTVIYRREGERALLTMDAGRWSSCHTCAEELALKQYLADGSEAELCHRFAALFAGRSEVCSVHWRSTLAVDGYNYLCENRELVPGCMFGADSCKNCRSGRLTPFSANVAAAHLKGDSLIGVYPITAGDLCRFMVIEGLDKNQIGALTALCRELEIPAYAEQFRGELRLWFFFASPVPAADARALGAALITRAMDRADMPFELYEKISPRRDRLAEGSCGKPVVLPLGKFRRSESAFVDNKLRPLPEGSAAIFGFRRMTGGYLTDRLAALGTVYGRLYGDLAPARPQEFPSPTEIVLNNGIGFKRLPPRTSAALKRMACFKNPEFPLEEFSEPLPALSACFREDGRSLTIPRGLWADVENLLRLSLAEYKVINKRDKGDNCYFRSEIEPDADALRAAKALCSRPEGILLGPTGSGKTAAICAVIAELHTRTLILTADENTRRRWADNVYRLLGVDAESVGSRIEVRLVTDEKLKDRYGLVVLADCSRVPVNAGIYERLSGLSPAAFYGLTSDDRRRDGLWGYIHMLCGSVVYRMEKRR